MHRHRPWNPCEDATLAFLIDAGDSIAEVAAWMGRSSSTVLRRARRAGLEPKVRRPFTTEDLQTIRLNYPDFPTFLIAHVLGRSESAVYQAARKLGMRKSARYLASPWACRLRREDSPGIAHRFPKGHVPANKGLRRPGFAPGRMAETQFKKGEKRGAAKHNYVPIGTEKVDPKRKVLMRKVTDDPSIFPAQRWRPVHVLVWEVAHGPVPEGHICVFRPGNKTFVADEITADKLEVISLAENMRRNTIHNWPEEIKKAMFATIALKRSITLHEKRGKPRE